MNPTDIAVASPIVWSKVLAWVASFVCVVASARCATVFMMHSGRVFTILSLFALNWAMLLPYYSSAAQTEMLPAFNGFLMVFIGRMIYREAVAKQEEAERNKRRAEGNREQPAAASEQAAAIQVDQISAWALWLFGFIIAPDTVSLAVTGGLKLDVDQHKVEAVIATLLTLLGFLSVCWGIKSLIKVNQRPPGLALILPCLLVLYSTLEVHYTVGFCKPQSKASSISFEQVKAPSDQITPKEPDFWRTKPSGLMTVTDYYLYAVAKCLFTAAFLHLLLLDNLKKEDHELSYWGKLSKFVRG